MKKIASRAASAEGFVPAAGGAPTTEEARRGLPPTVLILDDIGCEHFEQLASTLHRRGVRVVMVQASTRRWQSPTVRQMLLRWVRDRLAFDDRVSSGPRGRLPEMVAEASIADLLVNENTLAVLDADDPLVALAAKYGLAFTRVSPNRLIDKFEVNALLERSGIRIPPQISSCDMSPDKAVEAFGLPLVVKARVGAAGAGVRIANSVEEVRQALSELQGGDHGPAFYQRYICGRMVMYGAVYGPKGPLIEHGVRVDAVRWPLGPSARLHLYDHPKLLAEGRRAIEALGCRGFAEIGFLEDARGELWHIDANCRSWGNMVSMLSIGIDYAAAYAALVLNRPYAPEPGQIGASRDAEVWVLPCTLYDAASYGSLREIGNLTVRLARMCRRGPGAAYAAGVAIKVVTLLIMRIVRRLRPVRIRPLKLSSEPALRPRA